MFIPISDDDQKLVKPAYVTWTLILINVVVFLFQSSNPELTYQLGVVPAEITSGTDLVEPQVIEIDREKVEIPQGPGPWPIYLTLLTSMFMHGGWAHLIGNMLYLWIFGDNVEHRFGHLKFLVFYIVSGLAADAAQIAASPDSVVPMIGASGAVSGVLGAYLVLFPRNRVYVIFFLRIISVPAVVVIVIWVGIQIISSFSTFGTQLGGVAYMAHLGGFAAGVVAAIIARMMLHQEPDSPMRRMYERDPHVHRLWG